MLFKINSFAMKKAMIFFFALLYTGSGVFAQVGVSASNSTPDPSAGLDVSFTNKGLLPPRVALTAINSAIPVTAPAPGLLVYNTAVAGTPPYNVLTGYYFWNGAKWIPVTAPQGTNVGDMLYWNGTQWVKVPVGSNGQFLTFTNGIPTWGQPLSYCGFSMIINHTAGTVAPVSKTVTYGTVSNIPGEPTKCWITSNLGSEFDRKQGYKVADDGTTRTPNYAWIVAIIELLDWQAANDPCTIELGNGWRIPVYSEWYNVDNTGGWTYWDGPWSSYLKLHNAGLLNSTNGSLNFRGSSGRYWSSSQYDATGGWGLAFTISVSLVSNYNKASGFSLRCVRDY